MFGIICEEVGNIGRFLPVGEFGIDNAAEKLTELLHPLVEIEFAVDEVNLRHCRISISESARPILMAKRACLLSASGSSFGSVHRRPEAVEDRKSVENGTRGKVRVDLGG